MPDENRDAFIPLSVPSISGQEWTYVKECLDTGWVSSVGSYVDDFEQKFSEVHNDRKSVALASGTASLHLALKVAGVSKGDLVVTSALSFIAPANAVAYLGADPVFIDCELPYYQMNVDLLERYLEDECVLRDGELIDKVLDRRIAALLPVHHLGHPVEIDRIAEIGLKYGIPVVEDASESIGARYGGRLVGTFGDSACYSFNGNKLITAGAGGMYLSNSDEAAKQVKHLSTQAKCDPIEYDHDEIGYNYRLNNVSAAIGLAQLERLDDYIGKKCAIASRYSEGLDSVQGIYPMRESGNCDSVWWMYTVRVDSKQTAINSRETLRQLSEVGVQSRPIWKPLSDLDLFRFGSRLGTPVARQCYEQCLSIPCSVGLLEHEQDRVIDSLVRMLSR